MQGTAFVLVRSALANPNDRAPNQNSRLIPPNCRRVANARSADWVAPLGREHVRQWQARRRAEAGSRGILPRGRAGFQPSAGMRARFIRFCALASHLVELSQTVMHYLGAVFPGDPVSQPNQSPLNARQSAGSPEPSREALHEGHRRVASIA